METKKKAEAVVQRMTEEPRVAAWLAYLIFVLKTDDEGRYRLKQAGPKLLLRLANKLPMLGLWPSVSDILTRTEILNKQEIIATLPEIVGLNLMQLQTDLRMIANRIAYESVVKDSRGRVHLDEIGRVLAKINQEVIESPQNSNSSAPADKQQ